jgi:hypothetical protein
MLIGGVEPHVALLSIKSLMRFEFALPMVNVVQPELSFPSLDCHKVHFVPVLPFTLSHEFGGGQPPIAIGIPGIPSMMAVALTDTG